MEEHQSQDFCLVLYKLLKFSLHSFIHGGFSNRQPHIESSIVTKAIIEVDSMRWQK